MSRRRRAKKRTILLDPKYMNLDLAKFVNIIMSQGKKATARSIVYGSLDIINKKNPDHAIDVFEQALENVMPELEVRSRRVGGNTYQIPMEVNEVRAKALAFRWIHRSSIIRHEKTMREKLAAELLDASEKRGNSVKKKVDTHKMAESNRAFAHYRW